MFTIRDTKKNNTRMIRDFIMFREGENLRMYSIQKQKDNIVKKTKTEQGDDAEQDQITCDHL